MYITAQTLPATTQSTPETLLVWTYEFPRTREQLVTGTYMLVSRPVHLDVVMLYTLS